MLAANGSIFTILAISFERYYAICKPLKAGYKCTRLRATIIICLIWLLASILTSPILIMAKSSETIYIDGSLVYNCILETDTYWHKMYVFVSMFAFFCLPLLVLMLVYWLIGRRLIRENLAMSRPAASSHCPSTATTSTDLISTGEHHPQNHSSNGWYQTAIGGASKRIGLRKAASLKSISGFFASIGHHNHDHSCHRAASHHNHHPASSSEHHNQLEGGNQRRRLRLKASKAFSLDSHSHQFGKQAAINCVATDRTTAIGQFEPSPMVSDGFKMYQDGLSSSCVGHTACCCCCCCRCRHELGPSLPKLSDEKGTPKGGLIWAIFNQPQLISLRLSMFSCLWSTDSHRDRDRHNQSDRDSDRDREIEIEREGEREKDEQANVSSCSTSIEVGSNPDGGNQNDFNNNNNIVSEKFDVDQSISGASLADINGLSSSSCHSRRTDGITIMNSISESMPNPSTTSDSIPQLGGLANDGRVVVAAKLDDAPATGSSGDRLQRSEAPSVRSGRHRPLPEYVNDDCDGYPQGTGQERQQQEQGVDDLRASCDVSSRSIEASGEPGLGCWLANLLCPYSRRHCRGQRRAPRSSQPDNGSMMATKDRARGSSPLIAIGPRKSEESCRQCHKQLWWQNGDTDDKSAEAVSAGERSQRPPMAQCDYGRRQDEAHLQQTSKKSAHFDISAADSTLSNECRRQHPTDRHAATRTPILKTYADSFNCANGSPVRRPYVADANSNDSRLCYARSSLSNSNSNSNSTSESNSNLNSNSPSPDPILQGMTLRRSCQSDQITENPLERLKGGPKTCEQSMMLMLQNGQFDEAAYSGQQFRRALETRPAPRPTSVAALSGSSASSAATNTTTVLSASLPASDPDSLGKSSGPVRAATATTTTTTVSTSAAAAARILFVGSGKSHHRQQRKQCQEFGTQMKSPITSISTLPSSKRMSSDQYSIDEKTSRANSLVLDADSSVKAVRGANRMGLTRHHLAKRLRTRSSSKPIVCSQLHNGTHLSELLVVQDLSKKQQMDSRRQVVIMLAFVVACFFLLFFPYRVFTIWLILSTEDQVQSLGMETYYNLTYFSRILIYLHSAINPIAYNLISTKFRRAFMSILLCRGSSTRRHFTTDHQQRLLAKQQSYHYRKSSGPTNARDHHKLPSRANVVCQQPDTGEGQTSVR